MALRVLHRSAIRPPRTCTSITPTTGLQHHNNLHSPQFRRQQTRTFLPDLSQLKPDPQTLSARRTFAYPTYPIFSIIADIGAYPNFLPLLLDALVTQKSEPDTHYGRRWPQEATLTVGVRDITESFSSRVTCIPPVPAEGIVGVVEAVSGTEMAQPGAANSGPLAMLRTRWEVREAARQGSHDQTDVALSIEYRFNSPLYDMMSRAAMPRVADSVIAAFEARVGKLLGDEERIPPPTIGR